MIDLIVPRRLKDRSERYKRIVYKKIQDYIKNGSKGDLYLYGTPIESLPSNLKTVGGDLNLSESKILELPEGLTVNGYLRLGLTQITTLPSDLTVDGNLYLNWSQISSLPSNLKVGGGLYLSQTPLSEKYIIEQIRQMIEDNGGYVIGEIRTSYLKF